MISVGDHRVTVTEFDELATHLSGEVPLLAEDRDGVRQRVLKVLLAREAMLLEAEARELTRLPGVAQALAQRERELMADHLYAREVTQHAEPSPQHLDSLYAAFSDGEAVRARHILVPTEEEARAIVAELRGGADFAELARTRSTHEMSAPMGGDMGYLRRELLLPEMQDAVWQAPVGQVLSDPVQTRMGYHVIEVTEHRQRSFEEMRPELTGEARIELRRQREAEVGAQLRERYGFAWRPEVAAGVTAGQLTNKVGADSVIASWDGGVQTVGEFIQYSRSRGRRETLIDTLEARQLGEAGALRALLARQGLDEDLSQTTPELSRALRRARAELAAQVLYREVAGRTDVSPEALRRAYEEGQGNYRRPPVLHLREILVDERPLADSLAALVRGGADMAELARQHSKRLWAAPKGGDIGKISEGQPAYAKMARVARTARVGQIIGPFPSHGGYSIIRVLGREEGPEGTFEEAQAGVAQDLRNRAMDDFIDSLQVKYRERLEVDEEALQLTLGGTAP